MHDGTDNVNVDINTINGLFDGADREGSTIVNGVADERINPATTTLIEMVRQNPCLYDKSNASYHNNILKVKIWGEIASSVGLPDAKAVAARWKNLRGKYNKCRKKLAAIAHDPEKLSSFEHNKWIYYDEMVWLEPHMEVEIEQLQDSNDSEIRTSAMDTLLAMTMNNEKLSDDDSSSNQQADVEATDIQFCGEEVPRIAISSSNPNKRLRLQQKKALENFSQLLKNLNNSQQNPTINNDFENGMRNTSNSVQQFDEEELYGLSIGRRLSRLPPHKKALARIKFEQIFYELLESSAEESDQ